MPRLTPPALLVLLALASAAFAAEPTLLTVRSPRPHQVIQRTGNDPAAKPAGVEAKLGFADLALRWDRPPNAEKAEWECRLVPLPSTEPGERTWSKLTTTTDAGLLTAKLRAPAGWHRLELRGREGARTVHQKSVDPFGVGEVFIVAGQSYASNCNQERLRVADPQGRVTALNLAGGAWAVAHDPQPVFDGSAGGSIWPPLGDALVKELGVPIGFVNVAIGATSTRQWMPNGPLHPRLIQAGKTLGAFRAVLWQQGESDVLEQTTMEKYVANMLAIRAAAARGHGIAAPWLLAKSTHHPTVYNNPNGEGFIRTAVDELVKRPGFQAGPDTDALTGENRGDAKTGQHFSAVGQRRAAALWAASIQSLLSQPLGAR